jgi:hypothetical protein
MHIRSWIAVAVMGVLGLLAIPGLAQPGIGLGPVGGGQPAATGRPLSIEQAVAAAQRFVVHSGLSGVAPAHVMEFANDFYVAVTDTATGQGAFELLVDRDSGAVHPEPQSMTWNTKYGRMAGGFGSGPQGPGGPMMGHGFGPGAFGAGRSGLGTLMMGPGLSSGGVAPGGPANGGVRHDSAFFADMRLVHALLLNHDKIKRSVTKLSNGIRTVTESDDPQVAQLIKAHVASMARRLQNGSEFNVASHTLPTIFQNAAKIRTRIQQTPRGVIVTQTSDDPATVTALQRHASEVDDLVQGGMAAFMHSIMANGGPAGFGPGGPMMGHGFGPGGFGPGQHGPGGPMMGVMMGGGVAPGGPMMGGGFGPDTIGQGSAGSGEASVTLDQARSRAQQYLDAQRPGTKADEARTFPGYYTFDVSANAKPIGMLSVNASTGAVWYHAWHGTFIREKDLM